MLDLSHATEISELWEQLELHAALPESPEQFYAKSGTKAFHEQREFDRHYLRCPAIMRRELDTLGVYMRDCSRAGMGVLSPVQLFPRERVELWMKPGRSYTLEVIRCQRLAPQCYECGTVIMLR